MNIAYNMDCMEYMRTLPDKAFDLAVVDPPYGLGDKLLRGGRNGKVRFGEMYAQNQWDTQKPTQNYFNLLFKVSKNQIIWGANYFIDYIYPTRGIIAWDKCIGHPYNFSHWEFAWTSFDCIARKCEINVESRNRIHPTQKPIALYQWIFANYAKPGDKILDTHLGSGSSRIAAYDVGLDFVGCEIDKEYFDKQEERFAGHIAQQNLFLGGKTNG